MSRTRLPSPETGNRRLGRRSLRAVPTLGEVRSWLLRGLRAAVQHTEPAAERTAEGSGGRDSARRLLRHDLLGLTVENTGSGEAVARPTLVNAQEEAPLTSRCREGRPDTRSASGKRSLRTHLREVALKRSLR